RLDFSVNTNPLGLPERVRRVIKDSIDSTNIYPDPEKTLLHGSIAEHHGVRSANVLCGNGASELFMAIVHAMRPKNILIPVPSFYGYEYVAKACGAFTEYYERGSEYGLGEKFISVLSDDSRGWDMTFISCPNNPTGLMVPIPVLEHILDVCEEHDIYCVLDLCFLELTAEYEEYEKFLNEHEYPHLIKVYAFTKTYAMPGIRIGYIITEQGVRDRIAQQIPEWNISMLAEKAGLACLEEQQYLEESREFIRRERSWMKENLKELSIESYESHTNFLYVYTESPIFDILFRERILIRDCSNFRGAEEGYYRIALRRHDENKELLKILKNNM
ncbi:MAG: aminotransferase class I/II-fold pyridoxal phosphate-dependent enzyme, partial [Lachnospiraceae bacterium]|nr:aminotransferase class I/II-fold pyridoxal phosphate-dependent enzyme [Lachnospiraceae bacterium]